MDKVWHGSKHILDLGLYYSDSKRIQDCTCACICVIVCVCMCVCVCFCVYICTLKIFYSDSKNQSLHQNVAERKAWIYFAADKLETAGHFSPPKIASHG